MPSIATHAKRYMPAFLMGGGIVFLIGLGVVTLRPPRIIEVTPSPVSVRNSRGASSYAISHVSLRNTSEQGYRLDLPNDASRSGIHIWCEDGDHLESGGRKRLSIVVSQRLQSAKTRKMTIMAKAVELDGRREIRVPIDVVLVGGVEEVGRFEEWASAAVPEFLQPGADATAEGESAKGPHETQSMHQGAITLIPGESKALWTGSVLMRNDLQTPLRVKGVRRSCACSSVTLNRSILAPNEELRISVVNDANKPGWVLVLTDDPDQPSRVFKIVPHGGV